MSCFTKQRCATVAGNNRKCCSVLQLVAVRYSARQRIAVCRGVLRCVAVCCSVILCNTLHYKAKKCDLRVPWHIRGIMSSSFLWVQCPVPKFAMTHFCQCRDLVMCSFVSVCVRWLISVSAMSFLYGVPWLITAMFWSFVCHDSSLQCSGPAYAMTRFYESLDSVMCQAARLIYKWVYLTHIRDMTYSCSSIARGSWLSHAASCLISMHAPHSCNRTK